MFSFWGVVQNMNLKYSQYVRSKNVFFDLVVYLRVPSSII